MWKVETAITSILQWSIIHHVFVRRIVVFSRHREDYFDDDAQREWQDYLIAQPKVADYAEID